MHDMHRNVFTLIKLVDNINVIIDLSILKYIEFKNKISTYVKLFLSKIYNCLNKFVS